MGSDKSDSTAVLYARVPRALHEDLKALAERSGMPISLTVSALLAQAVADAGPDGRLVFTVLSR